MQKIEKKIIKWQVIRLLFFCDIVILGFIIALIVFYIPSMYNLTVLLMCNFLLLSLLSASIAYQLILYIKPAGTIMFDYNGITIKSKKLNKCVGWDEVEHILYNSLSWILCLRHFTLELSMRIDGKSFDFHAEEEGEIRIRKKDYVILISFIPLNIIDENHIWIDKKIIKKYKNKK